MTVHGSDIVTGLRELGLEGRCVEVHSSLSSFGQVDGGEHTVIEALEKVCSTIAVPTYSEVGRSAPPDDDRPLRNGCDYSYFDRIGSSEPADSFDAETFSPSSPIDKEMGAIPAEVLRRENARRSKHPSVSWAALGPQAEAVTQDHLPNDPNLPLKRMSEMNGAVLLLGVSLNRCSAVHLAEEISGRRPFIRWTKHSDGVVRRMRECGCSDGFGRLDPHVRDLCRSARIGKCDALAFPITEFVKRCSEQIQANPEITACEKRCERCVDALTGGPVE